MELVERFGAARPRLLSLAYRIVGSRHDAEDAVQAAWARLQTAAPAEVANLDGWLTTVTARLCLDLLRSRERRGELPLPTDDVPSDELAADEAYLRREDVSRALLVILDELTPSQRVAYVLHDLFAIPFDEVAGVLDTSPTAARKLASRGRAALRAAEPPETTPAAEQLALVEAFLEAARGGDLSRLVALLAPDAIRTAHAQLLPAGASLVVRGSDAIARETRSFVDRIAAATPVLVDGSPGAVIAPGGHALALISFGIESGLITRIAIEPYAPGRLSAATG